MRGILHDASVSSVRHRASPRREVAVVVAAETGKSPELALGEADAAVEMGFFVAGEGRRLYGRTTTSTMPNRTVLTVRQPVGTPLKIQGQINAALLDKSNAGALGSFAGGPVAPTTSPTPGAAAAGSLLP